MLSPGPVLRACRHVRSRWAPCAVGAVTTHPTPQVRNVRPGEAEGQTLKLGRMRSSTSQCAAPRAHAFSLPTPLSPPPSLLPAVHPFISTFMDASKSLDCAGDTLVNKTNPRSVAGEGGIMRPPRDPPRARHTAPGRRGQHGGTATYQPCGPSAPQTPACDAPPRAAGRAPGWRWTVTCVSLRALRSRLGFHKSAGRTKRASRSARARPGRHAGPNRWT